MSWPGLINCDMQQVIVGRLRKKLRHKDKTINSRRWLLQRTSMIQWKASYHELVAGNEVIWGPPDSLLSAFVFVFSCHKLDLSCTYLFSRFSAFSSLGDEDISKRGLLLKRPTNTNIGGNATDIGICATLGKRKIEWKEVSPKKLTAHLLPYQLLKVCLAKFSVIKERWVGVDIRVHSLVNNPARWVNLLNSISIHIEKLSRHDHVKIILGRRRKKCKDHNGGKNNKRPDGWTCST